MIGHVHLKVGSATQAARWYAQTLGLEVVAQLNGAAFLSWGGYHHHFGLNEWHTAGQGRPAAAAGLAAVTVQVPDLAAVRAHLAGQPGVQDGVQGLTQHDPWGHRLMVVQA